MKLAEDLPDYMIPVDLGAARLPAAHAERQARSRRAARAGYRRAAGTGVRGAARRRSKTSLASIWAEVLKLDRVSRDSDLFSLGAELRSVCSRSQRAPIARGFISARGSCSIIGRSRRWRRLWQTEEGAPSAAGIAGQPFAAAVIRWPRRGGQRRESRRNAHRPRDRDVAGAGGLDLWLSKPRRAVRYPASLAQQRFWVLDKLEPRNPALNVAVRWRIEGRSAGAS